MPLALIEGHRIVDRMGEHHRDHHPRTVERHCDVAVVGGSAAGLAAALQIARQRRSVIVVDAGEPRNAPATHMHGYLGHEGIPPGRFTGIGRAEVRGHGGEVLDGRVTGVEATGDGRLRLALTGGHAVLARRVVAATGLVDDLPAIPGVAERWGRDVIHCPFCHGFEMRDQPAVQIVTHPLGLHGAVLFGHLTDRLTVVLHDWAGDDPAEAARLRGGGVEVARGRVTRVRTGADGALEAVELEDGTAIPARVVIVTPRVRVRAEAFAGVGLHPAPHPSGIGDHIPVDDMGRTAVPGVSAAGNVTDPGQQALHAAAHGSRVGAMLCFDLADEDLGGASRRSAHADDWDGRYRGDRMWSGNPNGTLVREVEGLRPGRALDVGAGEGADAVWLAERGWEVTAVDISRLALDRAEAEARRRGLAITCRVADANGPAPFGTGTHDLVSAQYASIPRSPDGRGVRNLMDAVAPGGTLLVVSHDLEPMRGPIDTATRSRAFDPDAYVRVEDIAAVLADAPGWDVEVHETRPRPPGAATASHHVDDVVLRARRRP